MIFCLKIKVDLYFYMKRLPYFLKPYIIDICLFYGLYHFYGV